MMMSAAVRKSDPDDDYDFERDFERIFDAPKMGGEAGFCRHCHSVGIITGAGENEFIWCLVCSAVDRPLED